MSGFWGGFAGEGVKQLDKLREDNTVKLRIEDARKYQEGRYSLERADRKADNVEEDNRKLQLAEADDFAGIYDAGDGNYMRNSKAVGADGNITITPTQVKDPSLIQKWKEYDAAKKQKAQDDEYDSRIKRNNLEQEEFETATMGQEFAMKRRESDARVAASDSGSKSGTGSLEAFVGKGVSSMINSLTKNRKVKPKGQGTKTIKANGEEKTVAVDTPTSKANFTKIKRILGADIKDKSGKVLVEGYPEGTTLAQVARFAETGDDNAANMIAALADYLTFDDE